MEAIAPGRLLVFFLFLLFGADICASSMALSLL